MMLAGWAKSVLMPPRGQGALADPGSEAGTGFAQADGPKRAPCPPYGFADEEIE
jgi:hypothetical protein